MTIALDGLAAPSRKLMLLEGRALLELGAFMATLPLLNRTARGDGHPVLVLPGLVTSDNATIALRKFLQGRGYAVSGWGLGRNYGLRPGIQEAMIDKVETMAREHGRKVSLVGWSLGGLYARQLAKILPDHVRSVITLGSPFAGSPKATNAWRIYEFTSGQKADHSHAEAFGGAMHVAPPVPTTAIFSRTDGICAWQGCREQFSAISESIEVEGSHCGLGHHPAAAYAIADRLAQPEGEWKPFDRSGWRSFIFPDPRR